MVFLCKFMDFMIKISLSGERDATIHRIATMTIPVHQHPVQFVNNSNKALVY